MAYSYSHLQYLTIISEALQEIITDFRNSGPESVQIFLFHCDVMSQCNLQNLALCFARKSGDYNLLFRHRTLQKAQ